VRSLAGEHFAFTSDDRLVAVGEGYGVVRLLECETGREVARLEVADQTRLSPRAFAPDGGTLYAVGIENRLLYIWDVRLLRARLKALDADQDWPELPPAAPAGPPASIEVRAAG
jgi:hypothetical protein